jgi:hypothetical protein
MYKKARLLERNIFNFTNISTPLPVYSTRVAKYQKSTGESTGFFPVISVQMYTEVTYFKFSIGQ